jgi:hypothetical protein
MTKVTFPSGAEFEAVDMSNVEDGIDYHDPTSALGKVPLIKVKGREEEKLSENFRVKELKANDLGAHYARISTDLVSALQKIRNRIGMPIAVRNTGNNHGGYRHWKLHLASYPNTPIEKIPKKSRHLAGQAADFEIHSSQDMDGKELARIAIEEVGCDVGVGIGRIHIHLDVRGELEGWSYRNDMTDIQAKNFLKGLCNR